MEAKKGLRLPKFYIHFMYYTVYNTNIPAVIKSCLSDEKLSTAYVFYFQGTLVKVLRHGISFTETLAVAHRFMLLLRNKSTKEFQDKI